ncbi:MAG: hypothetical protein ACYS14_11365, partial [Planctomycetota bacterium]
KTFSRNLLLGGDAEDNVGKVIRQLNAFSAGLDSLKDVIADGISDIKSERQTPRAEPKTDAIKEVGQQVLSRMSEMIDEMKLQRAKQSKAPKTAVELKAQKDVDMLTSVLEEQFRAMETWLLPMSHDEKKSKQKVITQLMERFEAMVTGYNKLIEVLKSKYEPEEARRASKERARKVKPKVTKKRSGPAKPKNADSD